MCFDVSWWRRCSVAMMYSDVRCGLRKRLVDAGRIGLWLHFGPDGRSELLDAPCFHDTLAIEYMCSSCL
jgi:hypothetical protein